MVTAGYVGIAAEAAGAVETALRRAADDTAARSRRVAALLDEAGEHDLVTPRLRELDTWLHDSAADLRRRAALVAVAGVPGPDPTCVVPWTDPLVRAARAVWANATRVGAGAADSTVQTVGLVWQLVPGNHGWTRAWVDLGLGLMAAARDPRAAALAALDIETLDQEGLSYWIGGFLPDAAAMLLGGAGAAKAGVRTADAAHALRAGHRLADATRHLPTRRGAPDGVPLHARPRPRRNPIVEVRARADVRAHDVADQAHAGTRHGRATSLRQQLTRTTTGRTPDRAFLDPIHASRFFRWEDQAEAIRRAKAQWKPGRKKAIDIDLGHPVGEGYMTGTFEYRRTTTVRVVFDADGRLKTAYPLLPDGGPMP